MRLTNTKYFSLIPVLAAFFCSACAPMSEAQREAREYARVEFREQFVIDRELCRTHGGRFLFDGAAEMDRKGIPKTKVLYYCV
jgi:hypothetical protein